MIRTPQINTILNTIIHYKTLFPSSDLLGAFGIVLTLLPLGLIVVWLPVAVWLMSEGHTGLAVFVMVWNGLFVGSLDNVLRPYLIKRGSDLPTALIFLGVLGGVLAFGIVGVVLGPVLLAVAHTLFQNWGRTARAAADNLDHSQCGGAASVASSSEGESA
jgi:predicted PurR-regulated permease PerM